jgi:HPt (histidine-containing phosphotransfer) domain-containing protein
MIGCDPTLKGICSGDPWTVAHDASLLASVIAELTAEYMQELPDRLRRLGEAIDAARLQADVSARKEAVTEAHRLQGTGGSLGLHAISEAARRIEDALLAPEGTTTWQEVERGLAELTRLAAGAAGANGVT